MSFRAGWEEQLDNIVRAETAIRPLCDVTHVGMSCWEFDLYVLEKGSLDSSGIISRLGALHQPRHSTERTRE